MRVSRGEKKERVISELSGVWEVARKSGREPMHLEDTAGGYPR